MNVALIGSVSSSYHALRALLRAGVEVTGVLGLDPARACQVSDFHDLRPLAEKAGIPFQYFRKVNDPDVTRFIKEHAPDLLWVIGLSQMVPASLISGARHGAIGFHPTLLPKGRGRAPVAWTILLGAPAAANLFFLTDEPDAGDIVLQRIVPVMPDDHSEDLIRRTNEVLEQAIADLAPHIKAGTLPRTPQDHSAATYYPRRTPADGRIDWSRPTQEIYRLIRAASRPYPGAFCMLGDRLITTWRARLADPAEWNSLPAASPGGVVAVSGQGEVLVRTIDGALWLTEFCRRYSSEGSEPGEPIQLSAGDILQ